MKIKLSDPIMGPEPEGSLERLSRSELLVLLRGEISIRRQIEAQLLELKEKVFESEGKYFRVRSKLYGPSSERSPRPDGGRPPARGGRRPRSSAPRLPSERYPNAEIIEKHVTAEVPPTCEACGAGMADSGMTETSEYLTVIPKRYLIVRQHRHKYRCGHCHGGIVTTPSIPRLVPGSSYSDELIVDATLSKYCDLLPMERYTQMAARQGFGGLPPQSLIAASIRLAEIFQPLYERLRRETLATRVLLADETPHRMLEGDERQRWYLWGFLSGGTSCFYECHDTRSGEVAAHVLAASSLEVLLTDVYSGYKRAVRETNELRTRAGNELKAIEMAFCNSHARRGFVLDEKAETSDAQRMIDAYKAIYRLEAALKGLARDAVYEQRQTMKPYFLATRAHAAAVDSRYSDKGGLGKAFNYFLTNYSGLTLFLDNPDVPIDNNAAERILRAPVVGRKTWYGTHSRDGALAAAVHFSLVQSCRLVGLNPRTYYRESISRAHARETPLTPKEMAQQASASGTANSS